MKKYFFPIILITCLFTGIAVPDFKAYGEDEDFSPWAAWRKGFSYYEEGERKREKGDNKAALDAYRKAHQCYLSVKKARPTWNQQIIDSRLRMCEREIKNLAPQVDASTGTGRGESGSKSTYAESKAMRTELDDTKAELLNYKKKLFAALIELNELRQQNKQKKNYAEQVEDLMREKRILSEEYKLLQEKYTTLESSKQQPSEVEKKLKAQLVELKVKYDILAQRLSLQEKKETELKTEMAGLYGYKSKTQNSIQEFEKLIKNLQYKLEKANASVSKETEQKLKYADKITSLETYNEQINDNLKEKDKEIEKLNKWLQQLRKKSGSQNEIQQEILKANQLATKKYKELKIANDKNLLEIQQLNALLREHNVAEVNLRKELQAINTRRDAQEKEYQLLNKNYNHLMLLQKENVAEIKSLKESREKAESLVKSYSEKYKWADEKLKKRATADLENISMLNKQIRELNQKADDLNVSNKKLKLQLDSANSKYKNLQTAFTELKESNKGLKVNEKILAQEAESSKILKRTIAQLRAEIKSQGQQHTEALAQQSKELTAKLAAAEKESAALQEKYKTLGDQSDKLAMASNKISQLNEQLQHANKTIEILRNVSNKKLASSAKTVKTATTITEYTPRTAASQPLDPKKLLADGIKAEKNDAEELAVWNYRKYLSIKPDDIDVNRRLGTILFNRGQNVEAVKFLQKAYSQKPDDIKITAVYAQALINQKKFASASAILSKAIKQQPRNYKLLTNYASAQAGNGQTAAALDNLAKAIKISPENPKAYIARAQIIAVYHPDLLDTAASSYRKARELGAKPDVFLENALEKKLKTTDKNAEMIEFLKEPAKEAEQNQDWSSAAWYFGQLHKLKPAVKEYREKFAASLLLQKKYKDSLAALDLSKLSDNGRLIAASAEFCQGNCSQAATLLKTAKPAQDMPIYFKAVSKELLSISSHPPEKEKEAAQLRSQLEKLLKAAK